MADIAELEKRITDNCPKCKTNDKLRLEVHDSYWSVCCNSCFVVRGKYCDTPEEAVEAWNGNGVRR